ncbi:MAG: hemerythrin domain-containing protein [Alphaproteobacteria bacterium]|nr:hemerythrin domain-containing protein [Alphaproteobacteria bacterium]
MFSFERQITRTLHDEHLVTISVLERLEALFQKYGPKKTPDKNIAEITLLLGDIVGLVECDVKNHFSFEEGRLFPLLSAMGDSPITHILTGEHNVILPLGNLLSEQAKMARTDGFNDALWVQFRNSGVELIERMIAHIQKEEMALLPMLEDIVEEEDDAELVMEYAALG